MHEDNKLIHEAQKDPKAFGNIYSQYLTHIYRYVLARVGRQKEVAEDISQETFLKAFKSRNRFKERGLPYLAYLRRIAHNLLINHYRSKKTLPLEETEGVIDDALENLISVKEKVEEFERLIATLPEKHREIMILRYREDLPIKEIAQKTNKSENSVKLTLSRARKRLIKAHRTKAGQNKKAGN